MVIGSQLSAMPKDGDINLYYQLIFEKKTNSFEITPKKASDPKLGMFEDYFSLAEMLRNINSTNTPEKAVSELEKAILNSLNLPFLSIGKSYLMPILTLYNGQNIRSSTPEIHKSELSSKVSSRYVLLGLQKIEPDKEKDPVFILYPFEATIFQKNPETDHYFHKVPLGDYLFSQKINPEGFNNPFTLRFNTHGAYVYFDSHRIEEAAGIVFSFEQDKNRQTEYMAASLIATPEIDFLGDKPVTLPDNIVLVELENNLLKPHIYNFKDGALVPCKLCDAVITYRFSVQLPFAKAPRDNSNNLKNHISIMQTVPFFDAVYNQNYSL